MRSRTTLLALLLTIPALSTAFASGTTAVGAVGPDADGAFTLTFDVTRDVAGSAALSLDVTRDDGEGLAHATRELGAATFPAGVTRWSTSFLPAEGPGDYSVMLVVDGAPSDAVTFTVADGAGASTTLSFSVPDEPTFLNLTTDTVNADGKVKGPGEELITRATIADANGLRDVDAVVYRVERDGALVDTGPVTVNASSANATSGTLELRYSHSPLANATFRMTLVAMKAGSSVASASRTFIIKDAASTLEPFALANVTPDVTVTQTTTAVLADKNGAPLAASLEARTYRGSVRAEASGVITTLGAPAALADADGAGRAGYPLQLVVPARTTAGAYRVSLYSSGTFLGSASFDVRALPTLSGVVATIDGETLTLVANGTGDGFLRATLGAATPTLVPFHAGASVTLTAPAASGTFAWNASLLAREDGVALDGRDGVWTRAGFAFDLSPLRAPVHAIGAWRVEAPDWDLTGATMSVSVARWDGTAATAITSTIANGSVRLDAPPTLEAGRYTATLVVHLANGTSATESWSFEAGPWMRVTLSPPTVAGREARVVVENTGGIAIARLVVETDGVSAVRLETGGVSLVPSSTTQGRLAFADVDMAPNANATLVASLPSGPMRAGEHAAVVRVYAMAGAA